MEKNNPQENIFNFNKEDFSIDELNNLARVFDARITNETLKSSKSIDENVPEIGVAFQEKLDAKKELIRKYRHLYADNDDFFELCFGEKPRGKIEIIEGSVALHIRCYDMDDYVLAYSFGKVYGKVNELSHEKIEWYKNTAAAALSKVAAEDLHDAITIENVNRNLAVSKPQKSETAEELEARKFEYGERSRIHEEQHQINKLFVPQASDHQLSFMEAGMRDEILATYRGGRNTADRIYKNLTESQVYDYYYRNRFGEEALKDEDYKERLKHWLGALTTLEEKGYSSYEILSFLYWEPVGSWPKIAATLSRRV